MSPEIPDYLHSTAIIIGTSVYRDKRLPDRPAAANSLNGLKEILIDEQLCGWPPERVEVLLNRTDSRRLVANLRRSARDTTDVLLVYYVGHGTIGPDGHLCLAVTDTAIDDPDITGIEYRHIRSALLDSPARVKVVILDCCYSGRAIQALASPEDLGHSTVIRGAYVLAASDQAAHSPPPGQALACTSFTGELLELIRTGIPGGPDTLTLNIIYAHLRTRLHSSRLPDPNRSDTGTAGDFAFTRNAAYLPGPIDRFPRTETPPPASRRPWRSRILTATIVAVVMIGAAAYDLLRPTDASATCAPATTATAGNVIIGSANFAESEVIAQIYYEVLKHRGIAAAQQGGFTSREEYYSAVCSGQITIMPEYNGALLTTSVDPGNPAVSTSAVDTALTAGLPPSLMILNPSPAQDGDTVTVTMATAKRFGLKTIADLSKHAANMVFGGPSESALRMEGYKGLEVVYGLKFRGFQPIDTQSETIAELLGGGVEAADVFTTNPYLKQDHLVALKDPKHLFAAANIIPLVYKPGVNPAIEAALNAVSARLTMADLLRLNVQLTLDNESIPKAADAWVRQVGLG
jgi:glycine betaine/choline ABC-type transport system substrate-binding protein